MRLIICYSWRKFLLNLYLVLSLNFLYRPNYVPSKFAAVCSRHFSPGDFEPTAEFSKRTRLKTTAVPHPSSQFIPVSKTSGVIKAHKIKPSVLAKTFKVPKFTELKAKKMEINRSSAATSTSVIAKTIERPKVMAVGPSKVQRLVQEASSSDLKVPNADDTSELKKVLSDQQLTIHNLQFEKKQLVKERDELEKLLSDAEARNFELRDDLRQILKRGFSRVKDLKKEINSVLASNP